MLAGAPHRFPPGSQRRGDEQPEMRRAAADRIDRTAKLPGNLARRPAGSDQRAKLLVLRFVPRAAVARHGHVTFPAGSVSRRP